MIMGEDNTTNKKIIQLYYPALMVFLVFTFADGLLRGFIHYFSIELLLYIILWIFLTIQATYSYVRIIKVKSQYYPTKALLSDCIEIVIALYVCAAISGIYGKGEENDMLSYLHLSIPFLFLSINEFSWFVMMRNYDVPAIFRITILFCGMLAATISEAINHSFWNLVVVVSFIVLLGILRAIDKAPGFFYKVVTCIWTFIKRKLNYPKYN